MDVNIYSWERPESYSGLKQAHIHGKIGYMPAIVGGVVLFKGCEKLPSGLDSRVQQNLDYPVAL